MSTDYRKSLAMYEVRLREEERSRGTIEKYMRDIRNFLKFLNGRELTKDVVAEWKATLVQDGYAPVTVNSMLAALNGFLRFLGMEDHRVRFLKIQRRIFRDPAREMTREEYIRLVETATAQGDQRLALLMETICASGIRVSEVQYITVEAVRRGRAEIALKGKIRTILLPERLCRKLLKYAAAKKITSGEIFLTGSGKRLSRRQIWFEMKRLCKSAGVEKDKVFPHNLRHLFAVCFYRSCRDIARLADMLGHSSIETTRIYLTTTGTECRQLLTRLKLVI